jgi:transcriptional regulator with XRE-family HTH domain
MQDADRRRGRLIKRLRERNVLTREELASKANVSLSTVIDQEEGRTAMRVTTARKLGEALGIDPFLILHPEEAEEEAPKALAR